MVYFDRFGNQIQAGDTIHCILDDSYEEVIACGDNDLGIGCSRKDCIAGNPLECYPLSEFDTDLDWEVIEHEILQS